MTSKQSFIETIPANKAISPMNCNSKNVRGYFICMAVCGFFIFSQSVSYAQTAPQKVEPGLRVVPFPKELTNWKPIPQVNPVFQGAGGDAWDAKIRERGWIVRDGSQWRLYYTGYNPSKSDLKQLGLAVSDDGLSWRRAEKQPILPGVYVEDMMIVKRDGLWIMVAEGRDDIAHSLISTDGLNWKAEGPLDIRLKNGEPIPSGPRGTPVLLHADGVWNLFYERGDAGVWLARSADRKVWTNVSDNPVIALGPKPYDKGAVAVNQVIKIGPYYYAVLHANETRPFGPYWTTTLARSKDLTHWEKAAENPIIRNNSSSGQVVPMGDGKWRLYTAHPEVRVFEQSLN